MLKNYLRPLFVFLIFCSMQINSHAQFVIDTIPQSFLPFVVNLTQSSSATSNSFAAPDCVTSQCNLICDGSFELGPVGAAFNTSVDPNAACDEDNTYNWVASQPAFGVDPSVFTITDCITLDFPLPATPDVAQRGVEFIENGYNSDTWDGSINNNNHYMRVGEGDFLWTNLNGEFGEPCPPVFQSLNESFSQSLNEPLTSATDYVVKYKYSHRWQIETALQANPVQLDLILAETTSTCDILDDNMVYIPNGTSVVFPHVAPLNGVVINNEFPWETVIECFSTPINLSYASIYFQPNSSDMIMTGQDNGVVAHFIDDICLTPVSSDPLSAEMTIDPCSGQIYVQTNLDCEGSSYGDITFGLEFYHESSPGVWDVIPMPITVNTGTSDFDANGNIFISAGGLTNDIEIFILDFDWLTGAFIPDENYAFQLVIDDTSLSGCLCHPPHLDLEGGELFDTNDMVLELSALEEVICNGDVTTISSTISNGTAPFSYQWLGYEDETSSQLANVGGGIYTLQVTDANGCIVMTSYEVTELNPIALLSTTEESCPNQSDGSICIDSDPGLYQIECVCLFDGSVYFGDVCIENLPSGSYEITITSLFSPFCSQTTTVEIGLTGIDCCLDPSTVVDYTNYTLTSLVENWTTPNIIVDGDVIVPAGYTLNITGSVVEFTEGSRLIVEPTGRLNTTNATLTSHCDEFWGGVELRGNPSNGQIVSLQGVGVFISSEISNATVGIRHQGWIDDEEDTSFSGGFARIFNSLFKNNISDIRIVDYVYGTQPHATSITNCRFEIDSDFFESHLPEDRIYIQRILRLQIMNCDFDNFVPNFLLQTELTALKAKFASYHMMCSGSIEADCNGDPHVSGFTRGIHSNSHYLVDPWFNKVDRIRFDNHRNIFMALPDQANITRNTFNNLPVGYFDPSIVVDDDQFFPLSNYAVFLQGNQTCYLMDNQVNMNLNLTNDFTFGFILEDCGSDANRIYRNIFNDMTVGAWASGINRETGDGNFNTGLYIECNDFYSCVLDIYVDPNGFVTDNDGIKPFHGSVDDPFLVSAGNDFSTSIDDSDMKVDNALDVEVNHFYQYTVSELGDALPDLDEGFINVIPILADIQNQCNEILSNTNPSQNFIAASNDYSTTKDLYFSVVDGGDSYALTNEVIYSDYSEALELYYELMSHSPDLSEQVIIEAIQKEADLPKVLLTEILASNPQAAKSTEIQNRLDQRIDPLEQYQRDMINTGLNWVSYKEQLEAEMGIHLSKAEYFYDGIKDSILTDTLIVDKMTAILNHLSEPLKIEDSYERAMLLCGMENETEASTVLDDLSLQFELSEYDEAEIEQLLQLIEIRGSINSSSNVLSEIQIEQLFDIKDSKFSYSSTEAFKILYEFELIDFHEDLELFINSNHAPITNLTDNQYKLENFDVRPNPCFDFTILSGNKNNQPLRFVVYTISGDIMDLGIWNDHDFILDTSTYTPGTYIVEIKSLNNIQRLKLIKQ